MDEQSPFEETARRAVEGLGFEVHPQVGIAGFFIDLAVVDQKKTGRYVLGIECDGAAYHSSRSARDRDRLRQGVLEDHGWIIHRIWSTDWFQRPAEQLRRVAEAIERAGKTMAEFSSEKQSSEQAVSTVEPSDAVEREIPLEFDGPTLPKFVMPYREATISVPAHIEPHLLPTKAMAEVVFQIVEIEGPVHEDEVTNRVRILWGLGRAGSRIQDATAKAIRSLLVTKKCTRESGFLTTANASVAVRNREAVNSADLRKPDMLPPAEIRAGILSLIDISHGAARKEIPSALARMLGFKTTTQQLRATIDGQTLKLLRNSELEETNGLLRRQRAGVAKKC